MRDLVVREALQTMARDAARRFREQVASGGEIPYDISDSAGGSPLPQYTPLTERFVRDHAPLLRELDSFGAACAAIESAELATPYLAASGVESPADARRRAELAGVVFLSRLWRDSTDFSLDESRLANAIAEIEANGDAGEGEVEVVVPLRGLRMESSRVDLATAAIVRADTVDVPVEARASEASGGAGWEPTFLAATTVPGDSPPAQAGDEPADGPDAGTRAVDAFSMLITTLRLFKEGGVALGPHAWTRLGGGRWRRIATGAGRPRPGGYRLADSELRELTGFSRALAERLGSAAHTLHRPASTGALARAISRFEAGLERTVALDALNDHLLALRFLLEGGGPADLGLPMRVASLCAEPDARGEVKATIERAVAIERELWSGEPAVGAGSQTPAETAAEVEHLTRAILKDAAYGHLGSDLRATADEILLADGLSVGDGAAEQRGGTAEWDTGSGDEDAPGDEEAAEHDDAPVQDEKPEDPAPAQHELWFDGLDDDDTQDMKVIHQPDRINVKRGQPAEEESMYASRQRETVPPRSTRAVAPEPAAQPAPLARPAAINRESRVGRLLELHSAEREATAARVANLFPRPETTEWDVREISYDRSRRARAGERS